MLKDSKNKVKDSKKIPPKSEAKNFFRDLKVMLGFKKDHYISMPFLVTNFTQYDTL